MSTNFENSEEKIVNLSIDDMLFVDEIISENKIIINSPLVDVCGNDLNRAGMLTRYVYFYKLNKLQPFALTDKKMAEYLHLSVDKVEHGKAWLKTHDLLFVERKGIPASGYITPNISKIKELYIQMESSSAYTRNWSSICAEHIYNIPERDILESNKENTKRNPASGSPSSPKVDELRLAEEVFENKFWVLVPNKVGKAKAKKLFFRITNNCKNEKKLNEAVEGYKRYLDYLNKCKKNNFNRRPKDPATFLNIENELWLESWEFNEEQVVMSAGGSRVKQPENWKDRIGIAKNLGLLDNFGREEINDMYKEWKYIPREAKEAIASKEVDNKLKQIEEYRKAEKERKQKEEVEQKKEKIRLLIEKYEPKFQALRNELKFTFYTLEEVAKTSEDIFFDTIYKIREYERKLEEEEDKKQKQKAFENSKIAFEKAEREFWSYIEQNIDINKILDENKDNFSSTAYEDLKALFSNGENLTDVFFGEKSNDVYLPKLKTIILRKFSHDDKARDLDVKRWEAKSVLNDLQKEIA